MVIMFFDHGSTILIRLHGHYDEFSAKYWPIFDTDNSGTLNFEENMYLISAIYDGFARLVIKVRKLKVFSS